jgi:hypothetical protein
MALFWLLWLALVVVGFCAVLAAFFDGQPLQPSARETLIRHCEEQHAAIMRGDDRLGVYGKYPPADLRS